MKPLLMVLLLGLPGLLQAQNPGLMDQPQTFPWSVGLTPVWQEEAGGLAPGHLRVKTSILWFNTYRQFGLGKDMTQQIDMEGLIETVSAAWSPAPGWEWRGQVQGWALGGGAMDLVLSGFHGVLFLPNQGRDFASDGQYHNYLAGSFDQSQPTAGITQTSGGVRFYSGPWSAHGWVKFPVAGEPDWGWSDRWSAGMGIGLGERWAWVAGSTLAAGGSATLVLAEADPKFPGPSGGPILQTGVHGIVESPWGPRGLIQASWTKVPREGKGYLGQDSGLLTTGVQFPWGPSWTAELALTEEFFTWATMEVGFQLGVTWNP